MTDPKASDAQIRRRWINLGEFVAVAGLVISGLALWNSWSGDKAEDKSAPVVAVEKARAIPLALRGKVQDEGKSIVLAPVESGHALDSATLSANGRSIDIGSDGVVPARAVQTLVGEPKKDEKAGAIGVTVAARYVEAGQDRRGGGGYRIRYRWDGGGLFGGKSILLTGWSRG
jgi:hypothetical protein